MTRVIELGSTEAWRTRPRTLVPVQVEGAAACWPEGLPSLMTVRQDALGLFAIGEDGEGRASALAAAGTVDAFQRFVKKAAAEGSISWPFGVDEDLSLAGNVARSGVIAANGALSVPPGREQPRAELLAALVGAEGATSLVRCGRGAAFLVRGGRLALLTPGSDAIDAGLAGAPGLKPVVQEGHLQPGDLVALCSRALHAAVRRQLMRGDVEGQGVMVRLMAAQDGPLAEAASALLAEAAGKGEERLGVLLLRCAARPG